VRRKKKERGGLVARERKTKENKRRGEDQTRGKRKKEKREGVKPINEEREKERECEWAFNGERERVTDRIKYGRFVAFGVTVLKFDQFVVYFNRNFFLV
jgi:hypothetical protein